MTGTLDSAYKLDDDNPIEKKTYDLSVTNIASNEKPLLILIQIYF